MEYVMKGGTPLKGEVQIEGAKNAALGILAACVLTPDEVIVDNVPDVRDTNIMLEAIRDIGAEVEKLDRHKVRIKAGDITSCTVSGDFIKKIRASYYLLGALLGISTAEYNKEENVEN